MSEKEEKRAEIPHINQLNGRDNKIKKEEGESGYEFGSLEKESIKVKKRQREIENKFSGKTKKKN